MHRLPWKLVGQLAAVVALLLLVGLPLYRLFGTALEDGWAPIPDTLLAGGTGRAVWNTVWTSLSVTVLAVAFGALAAFATERSQAPGARWLRAALVASLLTAPLVSALGWARAYGPSGLSDDLLGLSWPEVFGPAGIVVVLAANAVPLAYVVVAAGLATRAEPDLERAARVSGATTWQAIRTVTLPLARPAIGAAAALVFVTSVNAFEVPAVLGIPAGFPTMTTRLYQNFALASDPASFVSAVILACALVVLSAAVVGPADAATGGLRAARTGGPAGGRATAGQRSWGVSVSLWVFVVATTVIPLVSLVLVAMTRAVGLAPVPANWTLANFDTALSGPTGMALTNSLLLASGGATAVLLLGGLTAALGRSRGGRALGTAVTLTFAVAGSALSVAILLAYGRLLRDTLLIILMAYLAKFWALGHRPLAGAAEQVPADLLRAGRVSGAGAVTAVRTILAPLLLPVLAASWLLVFLFAMHELTISSLLYGPGSQTLAVVILSLQQIGDVTVTSALSVLLTLLVAVAAALMLAVRRASISLGG